MRRVFTKSIGLARSSTAKDTSVLFIGNVATSFMGFLLIIILARTLSVEQMGVFSAFTNMAVLLSSLADFGISSGLVNFVGIARRQNNKKAEGEYIAAGLRIELLLFLVFALLILVFHSFVAHKLLATTNTSLNYLLIIGVFAYIVWNYSSLALRAQRRFFLSATVDFLTGFLRLIFIVLAVSLITVDVVGASTIYVFPAIITAVVGMTILGWSKQWLKITKKHYVEFMKFSSWIGVNKVASVISGKIDIQMLAALSGATATGLYSVPSRLIFFVTILVSSFSSVISPRLAAFDSKEIEKSYIKKTLAFSLLIIFGLLFWAIIANPFIILLFGEKYADSVPIFRLLIAANIPFVLTAPSVNAIIYSIKKPKYIGYFSVFQLATVVALNLVFIPMFGATGPTYSLIIINSVLAIYTWSIVTKYYWR